MEFASRYLNLLDVRCCCQGDYGLKLRRAHSAYSEGLYCRFQSLVNNDKNISTVLIYQPLFQSWLMYQCLICLHVSESSTDNGTHENVLNAVLLLGWDLSVAYNSLLFLSMVALRAPTPPINTTFEVTRRKAELV